MEEEYYLPWEWQPMDRMPDGCNDVEVRQVDGDVTTICSCDYWWYSKERKALLDAFRFNTE